MTNVSGRYKQDEKKHLLEFYDNKIIELELLKRNLEDMKKNEEIRIEDMIRQKESEKNLEIQKLKKQIEQFGEESLTLEKHKLSELYKQKMAAAELRHVEMEELFERKVEEAAKKMIKGYSKRLILAISKIKSALAELEDRMSSLLQYHEQQLQDEKTDIKSPEMLSNDRDYMKASAIHKNSEISQWEMEFKEQLMEQDKRIEICREFLNIEKGT